ncbi:Probable protein phosphatase 2C 44 [Linum perenne]
MSHGFHLVKGKSGHDMEDYHFAEYRKSRNHELGLLVVPSRSYFDWLLKIQPIFWEDPAGAIKNAYCSTDNLILKNSLQLGPGGSTAVTAIVIDGKDLWVANIGDSRAVVCESGAANQLTVDHEPHTERKRIENRGGFARAFGDQSLKAHLTSEPDVRHVPIDSTMEFVILASDGLWKVMKNQEAVDLVKDKKDPQAAAKRLTTEALARNSKDDISCIVIRFG